MRTIVQLKDGIHWVGAIDWNVRDFHGYSTYKGTTYNAFLVLDDKVTLFDTVKKGFTNDLLHNIHKVIAPEKIDYLVVNHVEPDHSGSIAEVVNRIKPEKIFCSSRGKQAHCSTIMRKTGRTKWLKPVRSSASEREPFSS